MKLKNLMKKIESANAIVRRVGYRRIYAYIEIDGLPLGDYDNGRHHFYDWNHVALALANEYVEEVQRDVATANLGCAHFTYWEIRGKTSGARILITLNHE